MCICRRTYVVARRDYYLQLQPAPISELHISDPWTAAARYAYVRAIRARAGRPAGRPAPTTARVRTYVRPAYHQAGAAPAPGAAGRCTRGCRRRDGVRMVGWLVQRWRQFARRCRHVSSATATGRACRVGVPLVR
jgi:hypothetical protein